MKRTLPILFSIFTLPLVFPLSPTATEAPVSSRPTTTQAVDVTKRLTAAILDFDVQDNRISPGLGKQITEVLTAMLTDERSIRLVDRSALTRVLDEHELNLTGLVNTEQAIQVGKLVGARIMITGKAFVLGEQLFITAKLIGTETTLVEGVMVKDKATGDTGALLLQLSDKIATRLRKMGPALVAGFEAADNPLPALKAKLAKMKLPTVAVIVTEQHVAHRVQATADPAVETEIKMLLRECGFPIMDVNENELAEWARDWQNQKQKPWPRSLDRADIVVTGEAFSEFASRIGNLVSCAARAEVNVINRHDGQIIIANRSVARGVDLAENIAGRKALQKTGRTIALEILHFFADNPQQSTDNKVSKR